MPIVNVPVNLAIDLTTTQQELLGENPKRSYCLLVNDSDAVCYLNLGIPAEANRGIRLNASGGSYEINYQNPWHGRIYGISTGATKRLTIIELSYA